VSQGKITSTELTDGANQLARITALASSIPATDAVAKAQAFLSEPELLLAMLDAGYFSPNTPPGELTPGKCRRRLTASPNDDTMPRHGHPVFRHSHQMAAASKRQAPKGSGTRNMPQVASATGELILRKFVMSSGAPASGQGRILNKVLTRSAGNEWGMVNAPARGSGNDVPFTPDQPESAGWPGAWLTGVGRGNFDATSGLCQQP
jgi:hypothetical protein